MSADTTPAALAQRAAEELAQGGYETAQATALVAIAEALVAKQGPIDVSGHVPDHVPDCWFVDDYGRTWEWCGGVPGTWAWRITIGAGDR